MEAPLTALGELQARLAGRKLASPATPPTLPIPDGPPLAIVHSPLGRARRSAELAVAEMNAAGRATPPLRPDAGFCEIAQGSWEGLTDRQITARFGDSLAGWRRWPTRFHAPGGENLEAVEARVQTALAKLLAEMATDSEPGTHDRHQVLGYGDGAPDQRRWSMVVGHGGVFRVVMCVLLGLSDGALLELRLRAGRDCRRRDSRRPRGPSYPQLRVSSGRRLPAGSRGIGRAKRQRRSLAEMPSRQRREPRLVPSPRPAAFDRERPPIIGNRHTSPNRACLTIF